MHTFFKACRSCIVYDKHLLEITMGYEDKVSMMVEVTCKERRLQADLRTISSLHLFGHKGQRSAERNPSIYSTVNENEGKQLVPVTGCRPSFLMHGWRTSIS